MGVTDSLLENASAYAESFAAPPLTAAPALHLAVVACMDARIIPTRLLGLREGDAHVIRNAGGIITDDTIRSLAISQRKSLHEDVTDVLVSRGNREVVRSVARNSGARFSDSGFWRLVQRTEGFEATIVSGEVVYRQGEATDALPGRLIRGAGGSVTPGFPRVFA